MLIAWRVVLTLGPAVADHLRAIISCSRSGSPRWRSRSRSCGGRWRGSGCSPIRASSTWASSRSGSGSPHRWPPSAWSSTSPGTRWRSRSASTRRCRLLRHDPSSCAPAAARARAAQRAGRGRRRRQPRDAQRAAALAAVLQRAVDPARRRSPHTRSRSSSIAAVLLALGFLGLAHALIEGARRREPRASLARGRTVRLTARLTVALTLGLLALSVGAYLLAGSDAGETLDARRRMSSHARAILAGAHARCGCSASHRGSGARRASATHRPADASADCSPATAQQGLQVELHLRPRRPGARAQRARAIGCDRHARRPVRGGRLGRARGTRLYTACASTAMSRCGHCSTHPARARGMDGPRERSRHLPGRGRTDPRRGDRVRALPLPRRRRAHPAPRPAPLLQAPRTAGRRRGPPTRRRAGLRPARLRGVRCDQHGRLRAGVRVRARVGARPRTCGALARCCSSSSVSTTTSTTSPRSAPASASRPARWRSRRSRSAHSDSTSA